MFSSINSTRAFFFGVFAVLAIAAPWWACYILGMFICMRYFAYEILLAGIFLDYIFADNGTYTLFYTTSFLLMALLGAWVRTKLL